MEILRKRTISAEKTVQNFHTRKLGEITVFYAAQEKDYGIITDNTYPRKY